VTLDNEYAAWRMQWNGDYNGEDCEKCGRERVLLCNNGKRRCEKCNWCPETQRYEMPPW
jgi:hypothetical protein